MVVNVWCNSGVFICSYDDGKYNKGRMKCSVLDVCGTRMLFAPHGECRTTRSSSQFASYRGSVSRMGIFWGV